MSLVGPGGDSNNCLTWSEIYGLFGDFLFYWAGLMDPHHMPHFHIGKNEKERV